MYYKLSYSELSLDNRYDIQDTGNNEISEHEWTSWTQVLHEIGYLILSKNNYKCDPLRIDNKVIGKDYLRSAFDPHFCQVISKKMLEVMSDFNLTSHTIFSPAILCDDSQTDNYVIYKIDESIANWIDLSSSKIDFDHIEKEQEIPRELDTAIRHKLYGRNILIKSRLIFRRLVLEQGFDVDYFTLFDHCDGPIVSQRLMEALQSADIRGLSYDPMPEIKVSQEAKTYVKPKVSLSPKGEAITTLPDMSHPAVSKLVDWIKSPLEFGKSPDGLVIIDKRKLYWPTQEVLDCYLMAYTVSNENYIGFSGPTVWTFFGIDYSSLTIEELYLRYVGWYIATFTPPPETDHTIDTDPSLIELIDYMKGDGFQNPECVQRINLNGVVYYELHADHLNGKSVIVGTDGDFDGTWEPKELSLYERIGQDWDPFGT